jgi:hypothetical protein
MNDAQITIALEMLRQIAKELGEIRVLLKGETTSQARRLEDIQAKLGTLVQASKR